MSTPNTPYRNPRRRPRRKNPMEDILLLALAGVLVLVFILTGIRLLTKQNSPAAKPTEGTTPSTAPTETASPTTTPPVSQPGTDGGYTIGTAPVGYFDDALFIGDSRTVGLAEYGRIRGATFFATTGMSVYNIDDEQVPMAGGKKTDFRTLLQENTYGKIYVMLGINELGYDRDETIAAYEQLLLRIRREQPNAVIILQANLHVTAQRSEEDDVFNNEGINDFNSRVRELADNKTIFYLDVNELFDDEDGNLNADYTFDQTHILGKYYGRWAGWLDKNAVIPS